MIELLDPSARFDCLSCADWHALSAQLQRTAPCATRPRSALSTRNTYACSARRHQHQGVLRHLLAAPGEPESRIKIPKAIDFDFADPQSDEEREIEGFIDEFNRRQTIEAEQELFKQRKPLADAERTLLGKPTKAAAEQAHRDQQNRGAS